MGMTALLVVAVTLVGGCLPRPDDETSSTTTSETPTTAAPSTATTIPPTTASTTSTTVKPSTTATTRPAKAKEYSRVPTDKKVVALTFDAAYEPTPLKGILKALSDDGVTATFFLTGEFVEDFPDSVAAILKAGYPIGNHSYSHPDFTTVDDAAVKKQIRRTADLLISAGAEDPRPLFRFPYGARDDHELALLAREGYVSIYWTIDTLDWKTDRTPEQIRQAVLKNVKPGAIILMHVGSPQTAGVLSSLIRDLKDRGYGFVNLRDAL